MAIGGGELNSWADVRDAYKATWPNEYKSYVDELTPGGRPQDQAMVHMFGMAPSILPYREWQALRGSLGIGQNNGTTPPPVPPPSGGGGNNQQGCINGICPMPGLPPYGQPPANWQQQLPGMSGNPMGPLYNYDPSFGLGLGTQAAGIPNWQNMLAQLFQQYNPPQ